MSYRLYAVRGVLLLFAPLVYACNACLFVDERLVEEIVQRLGSVQFQHGRSVGRRRVIRFFFYVLRTAGAAAAAAAAVHG